MLGQEITKPLRELMRKLRGVGGREVLVSLKRYLLGQNPWTKPELLEEVGTFECPAIGVFSVAEHYRKGPVIGYLGGPFDIVFGGIVEPPVEAATIHVFRLTKVGHDYKIIAELSGEQQAKVFFGQLYEMMARQMDGKEGPLLVGGQANIFYPIEGWVVRCSLYFEARCDEPCYWHIYVYPADGGINWDPGDRVISCFDFREV